MAVPDYLSNDPVVLRRVIRKLLYRIIFDPKESDRGCQSCGISVARWPGGSMVSVCPLTPECTTEYGHDYKYCDDVTVCPLWAVLEGKGGKA